MHLPQDVAADILSLLPVKSLLRFQCVSKPWCSMIKNKDFIKLHLRNCVENNTKFTMVVNDDEKVYTFPVGFLCQTNLLEPPFGRATRVLGSCNGLLCIRKSKYPRKLYGKYHYISPDIALWNPSTKLFHVLPISPIQVALDQYDVNDCSCVLSEYAFGHDSVNDDYKVLRIVQLRPRMADPFILQVQVYSLKANSWKKIVAPSFLSIEHAVEQTGFWHRHRHVIVREAFHWLLMQRRKVNIVAFDIQREKFRTVPLPNLEAGFANCYRNLGVLGDCLCLAFSHSFCDIDIWVMKEYGMKDSWVKLLSLEPPLSFLVPLGYSKESKDKVLLEVLDKNYVLWYDLKRKTYQRNALPMIRWYSCILVGSLVSPFSDACKINDNGNKKKRGRDELVKLGEYASSNGAARNSVRIKKYELSNGAAARKSGRLNKFVQ